MRISTKGTYAVQLMIYLARHENEDPIALKEVCKETGISKKYLEQIGFTLATAKLVRSVRGASGGYKLARNAKDITMLDILMATEGTLTPVEYMDELSGEVTDGQTHYEVFVWRKLHKIIKEYLGSVTLQDIVDKSYELEIDSYSIQHGGGNSDTNETNLACANLLDRF